MRGLGPFFISSTEPLRRINDWTSLLRFRSAPSNFCIFPLNSPTLKPVSIFSLPQWLKNLLIFVPAIFGHAVWTTNLLSELLWAFLGFSLLSSAVYLQNDLADRNEDAIHPEKSKRPIASGELQIRSAFVLAVLLFIAGTVILFFLSYKACMVGLTYVLLNIAYTWMAKNIALLDVLFLIQGYWLRLILGSLISGLVLSYWVLGVVGLLAAYLVLFKRLGDVRIYRETDKILRKSIPIYASIPLSRILDVLAVFIGVVFLAYIIVVFNLQGLHFALWVYASVPLVWFALYRFHRSMKQNPMKDPLFLVFNDAFVVLTTIFAFTILCLSLYLT